jgi:molybdopterin-guanine dinucleotide biosynthesis protein
MYISGGGEMVLGVLNVTTTSIINRIHTASRERFYINVKVAIIKHPSRQIQTLRKAEHHYQPCFT